MEEKVGLDISFWIKHTQMIMTRFKDTTMLRKLVQIILSSEKCSSMLQIYIYMSVIVQ